MLSAIGPVIAPDRHTYPSLGSALPTGRAVCCNSIRSPCADSTGRLSVSLPFQFLLAELHFCGIFHVYEFSRVQAVCLSG